MPIEMPVELRFPMGGTTPLTGGVVQDFISLARKASSSTIGRQQIIEKFKEFFAIASGDQYAKSSNLSWAESDLEYHADRAASDAPGFIAAFCDACEALENWEVAVPGHQYVNNILEKHSVPYRVIENQLVATDEHISPPDPVIGTAESTVSRALADAKALVGHSDASSAIDRAHTALHGYLLELCDNASIPVENDASLSRVFKVLRQSHSALTPDGPRASDVTKILQSFAASIDALSTIRNRASLAHANELLDEPEATVALNAVYTIFRYVQDCIKRFDNA
ncbi:MAG: abortive infection family protein [Idiomarina sp.]|nr:abortive infection family protein [Idiomarina sp.]